MALEWIERYDVTSVKHEGWAVVVVDSKGFLGVFSDYGNYAYHWTHFGDDFKKFLAGLDWDYLYGKLMQLRDARVYDGEATLQKVLGRARLGLLVREAHAAARCPGLRRRSHAAQHFETHLGASTCEAAVA